MERNITKAIASIAVLVALIGLSCASYPDVPKDSLPSELKVFVKTSTPDVLRIVNDQGLAATIAFEAFERSSVEQALKNVDTTEFKKTIQDLFETQSKTIVKNLVFTNNLDEANIILSADLLTWDFNAGPVDINKKMEDLNFAHVSSVVQLSITNTQSQKTIWTTKFKATESLWVLDDFLAENPIVFWQRAIEKATPKPLIFLNLQFSPDPKN